MLTGDFKVKVYVILATEVEGEVPQFVELLTHLGEADQRVQRLRKLYHWAWYEEYYIYPREVAVLEGPEDDA
jgi:hypothetical protein